MTWKNIQECYPEEYEKVLVYNSFMDEISIDYILCFDDEKVWACSREKDWKHIAHWMPLPKLPLKEKECSE